MRARNTAITEQTLTLLQAYAAVLALETMINYSNQMSSLHYFCCRLYVCPGGDLSFSISYLLSRLMNATF